MIAPQPAVDVPSEGTLEEWFRAEAPHFHAYMAVWARKSAAFENLEGWRGAGMRSCVDWFVTHLGFNRLFAEAMLRAGHAERELPEVGEAFSAGELSLEKVRLLSTVATDEDQGAWVQTAREASPPELARMCRESRNSERTDAPERDRAQRAQRRLRTWYDEVGMLRISGALPSEDGAMVRIALDKMARRLREKNLPIELDPPDDPFGAHQADALVSICTAAALGEPGMEPASAPPARMVVHVDLGVLTGATPNGRGHIEDGPALSTAVLRRLGCDATIKTLIERDGVPIASGREKPTVSRDLKLMVQSRDGTCLYPGCAVPATRCDAHHIHHWADGGPTELWNLGSACPGHHDRHHDGEFDIIRTLEGDLHFVKPDGRLIGKVTGGKWKRPRQRAGP
jgi:hypothetical protein